MTPVSKDDREKVLRKIKKMLTLANNKGATPDEAAGAAAMAQQLLLKYSLTEADVENLAEPKSYILKDIEFCTTAVRLQAYEEVIRVAARSSMCRVIHTTKKGKVPAKASLIGTETQIQVAEYLFEYLSNTLWATTGQQMPPDIRKSNQHTQNRFRYTFVISAVQVVERRLKEPLEEARKDAGTQALMVVNDQMLAEAVNQYFPSLRVSKPSQRSLDDLAIKMGAAAGKAIPLNKGVGAPMKDLVLPSR